MVCRVMLWYVIAMCAVLQASDEIVTGIGAAVSSAADVPAAPAQASGGSHLSITIGGNTSDWSNSTFGLLDLCIAAKAFAQGPMPDVATCLEVGAWSAAHWTFWAMLLGGVQWNVPNIMHRYARSFLVWVAADRLRACVASLKLEERHPALLLGAACALAGVVLLATSNKVSAPLPAAG